VTRNQLQRDLAYISQIVALAREIALDDGMPDARAFELVREAFKQCEQTLLRVRTVVPS
jgi:hypothetical protein